MAARCRRRHRQRRRGGTRLRGLQRRRVTAAVGVRPGAVMRRSRSAWGAAAVALLLAAGWRVDAHKPITSPCTFTEDVLPILRDRCTACHVAGGVAPMALTTPEEAIPWGESIRLELIAGHMPPWGAISNGARLRHAEGLSARELNVLLTWVTGGTPVNAPAPAAL